MRRVARLPPIYDLASQSNKYQAPNSGRPRKRGPQDGYNGMTLRVLFQVYASVPRGITRKDVENALGVTGRAVLYHLKKLREAGLIYMSPKVPKSPGTIYIHICYSAKGKCGTDGLEKILRSVGAMGRVINRVVNVFGNGNGGLFSARGLAKMLGVSVRTAERVASALVNGGFAIALGGVRCRYRVYLWTGGLIFSTIIHRHRGTVRHRFRSNGGYGKLRRLVKEYCDTNGNWDWHSFRKWVLRNVDDPEITSLFLP